MVFEQYELHPLPVAVCPADGAAAVGDTFQAANHRAATDRGAYAFKRLCMEMYAWIKCAIWVHSTLAGTAEGSERLACTWQLRNGKQWEAFQVRTESAAGCLPGGLDHPTARLELR